MSNATIIIGGPTASGKTAFAIKLAQTIKNRTNLKSEIVNADSVQMYRDLKILTAHPSDKNLTQVKHNLFGILSPYESSDVTSWLIQAKAEIERIHSEDKIAIICGGTGFYIRALLNGIDDIPKIPEKVRKSIKKYFNEVGKEFFFAKLAELDPESAGRLHKNDTQRILRAYEVVFFTKKPLSKWWKAKEKVCKNSIPTIVLLPERNKIRERARVRICNMFANGVVNEVAAFNAAYPHYDGPLRETIGYREICYFIEQGRQQKEQTIENICTRTNQYIKRQSTWFRNQIRDAKFIQNIEEEPSEETINFLLNALGLKQHSYRK